MVHTEHSIRGHNQSASRLMLNASKLRPLRIAKYNSCYVDNFRETLRKETRDSTLLAVFECFFCIGEWLRGDTLGQKDTGSFTVSY